ncbi:glycosyltransferase family protein [Falsiroseomonas oryzae]|uniref:hypothetical protein n=1 Tax=Falsiroseomonas oryzae TaxID=2766473 RepID=UPI0022EB6855|nr:hypothetical protein [Roseomonas sp. MO-31]
MILVFETTWTGTTHAPGNSATLQIIARAWPSQRVVMHAEPSHLEELQRDPELTGLRNLDFRPIALSDRYRGRPHIVSLSRLVGEWQTIRAALAAAPRNEPCLVMLISATCTSVFAASWACRLAGRRCAVQVGLHGNLNDAFGWRPRNPLARALDTRAALEAALPVHTRFLVLEEAIRTELARLLPAVAARTDVLPLPVNTAEVAATADPRLAGPVRIGFVGLGSAAKGFDLFLGVATRLRARFGDRVEFVHVGRAMDGTDDPRLSALAHPPAHSQLSRAEFTERLAGLHYVLLPFREDYYNLSASGALLDALTWLKPVLVSRVPLSEQYFAEYGDIGALCDDQAGFEAAVEAILRDMDGSRYARQVAALHAARESRRVTALAGRYRRIVEEGFPALLT